MPITAEDLDALRKGQPPRDPLFLKEMTLGENIWLDWFSEHYLENFILKEGSKVKVFTGGEGSGKTHLLRWIESRAQDKGYITVFLDLSGYETKLSDIISIYKSIATQIDQDKIIPRLCQRVGYELGYPEDRYNGSVPILPLMVEDGLSTPNARLEIRKAAQRLIDQNDLSLSFATFAYNLISDRMIEHNDNRTQIYWNWFCGEKLLPAERKMTRLYDRLTRPTARVWLYSLIRLVNLCGMKGLVLLVDGLETITERLPGTNRYYYTPNQAKDTCELIRQMIDDVELQRNLMIVLSGRPQMIDDERRGFKSYEALWMRLQSGLVHSDKFNKYADIVDIDRHLQESKISEHIDDHLQQLFKNAGLKRGHRVFPGIKTQSSLRRKIVETANLTKDV